REEPLVEVRDKIPASLRDLSVALMGASASQVNQMQAAVRQLTGLGSRTEAADALARVQRVQEELDATVRERGRAEAALRAVATRERQTLQVDGLDLRPLQVGQWLLEHAADGWLTDA